MSLINLIYISAATGTMTTDILLQILEEARRNNPPRDITGMLLYQNGFFIQVLEGEEADVDFIFGKIQRDNRHQHIIIVERTDIDRRAFANWSMGFKNLDEVQIDEVEGLTEFLENPMTTDIVRDNPTHAVRLLERFKIEYGW